MARPAIFQFLTNCRATAYPAGWDIRCGGANSGNPASGDIEVWKDSATQAPRISNFSGGSIVVEVVYNP